MSKPNKKYPLPKMYDYTECEDFINEKHNVRIDDYFDWKNHVEKRYFNFWHYVSDYHYFDGQVIFSSQTVERLGKETHEEFELVAKIMNWFLEEFGEEEEISGGTYKVFTAFVNH